MKRQRARTDTTSCVSRGAGGVHDNVHGAIAQRRTRYFLDCAEMPMAQGFLQCSVFPTIAASKANAQHACACRSSRNRSLSIPSDLCKKNSVKRLAGATLEIESVTNRANRVGVIRRTQSEDGRRRTHGDAFAHPFSFLVRRRRRQTPSLRLSNSLTVCGLALPPDAFMT